MKTYTETQRLDWMLFKTPALDFDWRKKAANKSDSHWIVVWIGSGTVVYTGADYRECIDKAMADSEIKQAEEIES